MIYLKFNTVVKLVSTILVLFSVLIPQTSNAQSSRNTIRISEQNISIDGFIPISPAFDWMFLQSDPNDASFPDFNSNEWIPLRPNDLTLDYANDPKVLSGWFTIQFQVDSIVASKPFSFYIYGPGGYQVYLNGVEVGRFGLIQDESLDYVLSHQQLNAFPEPVVLNPDQVYSLAIRVVNSESVKLKNYTFRGHSPAFSVFLTTIDAYSNRLVESNEYRFFSGIWLSGITLLAFLFALFFYQNITQKEFLTIALATFLIAASAWFEQISSAGILLGWINLVSDLIYFEFLALFVGLLPIIISQIVSKRVPKFLYIVLAVIAILYPLVWYTEGFETSRMLKDYLMGGFLIAVFGYVFSLMLKNRRQLGKAELMVAVGLVVTVFLMFFHTIGMQLNLFSNYYRLMVVTSIYLALPLSFLGFVSIRFNENVRAIRKNLAEISALSEEKLRVQQEKQKLVESQNVRLEQEVALRTSELSTRNDELTQATQELQLKNIEITSARDNLQQALEDLKATQDQLIQKEKLASLGQLTAGIAHEIKNPLNFVNNFSEVSLEMIDEAIDETRQAGDNPHNLETITILTDIKANLTKIHEHGSRADGVVKSMLQHSRGGSGVLEPTDLNGLVKEYVNLAFHGMRAGKNPIDVDIKLDLDESIGQVPLIAEDFSRVILNVCNNGFDALREKTVNSKLKTEDFEAKLKIRTRRDGDNVIIEIEDNGIGIPDDIKDKILQPFFTTKKGTQGTGLGLSITHDIIKAHGGTLEIKSEPGKTSFNIQMNG